MEMHAKFHYFYRSSEIFPIKLNAAQDAAIFELEENVFVHQRVIIIVKNVIYELIGILMLPEIFFSLDMILFLEKQVILLGYAGKIKIANLYGS